MFYIECDEWILNIFCSFQTMKPLMEKRRRARINDSLNHLKNLILPLTGRDVSYFIHLTTHKKHFSDILSQGNVEACMINIFF